MGPCRISKKSPVGVCGADADTIVARNFLRAVAAGCSAHSDHGRGVAEVFLAAAKGEAPDYQLKDTVKLQKLAGELGVQTKDRTANEIAVDIGKIALEEFGKAEGTQLMARRRQNPARRFGKSSASHLVPLTARLLRPFTEPRWALTRIIEA